MDCGLCRRVLQDKALGAALECDGIEYVAACPTGDVKVLNGRNAEAVELIFKAFPGLFDGMEGTHYEALEAVFRIYRVPEDLRPVIMDRALVVIGIVREIRREEREKNKR